MTFFANFVFRGIHFIFQKNANFLPTFHSQKHHNPSDPSTYNIHTDLHFKVIINFIARMQGMGGTMMAGGGMQQRMAVGGNPGKDTRFFAQEDY